MTKTDIVVAGAVLLLVGCGRRDDSADYVRAALPPPQPSAPMPQNPVVLALLAPPTPEQLPAGYAVAGLRSDWLRPEASNHGALGKVTIDLTGPWASQKLSFTVYPDAASAKAGFAEIAMPPQGRNVERTQALTPPGFATELWGEDSFERYDGKQFVRTSLATTVDGVIALAQIHVEGDAQPGTATDAAALLRVAVAHIAARTADVPAIVAVPPLEPAAPATQPATALPTP